MGTVTHSTNGTYFMTVGWAPGGYSGIQQSGAQTSWAPSSKNFICSMWDTNTDNHGNAEGGTPSYSYVDELNEEADVGGQVGVTNRNFGGGNRTADHDRLPLGNRRHHYCLHPWNEE